jgi:ATP-binding cassette, subfamily B, bacterial
MSDTKNVPVIATLRRGLAAAPELRDGLAFTVALAVLGASGRLVVPIVMQRAIDGGLKANEVDVASVARLCAVGFVAVVLTTMSARWAAYRLGVRAEIALASLRQRTFDRIVDLSLDQHARQRRGVMVARVTSDVETVSQFFSWGAIAWVIDGMVLVVVGGYMVARDWRLGLVTIIVGSPVAFVLRRVQRHLVAAYDKVREYVGTYLSRVAELVSGAAVVRAYDAGPALSATTATAVGARRDAAIRAGTIASFLFPSGEVFTVLAVAATVTTGLWIGPSGGMTAGALVGATLLTMRFLEPIAEITEITDQTQLAAAGLSRVLDVLELPADVVASVSPQPLPTGRLAVAMRAVSFAYPPRRDGDPETLALDDVTIAVPAGSSLAVVGATGSGKSTLARLLVRTADAKSGAVTIGGVDIAEIADSQLRQRVQLVPQEPFLFDTTIAENLRIAGGSRVLTNSDLDASIDALGLRDWVDTLPEGLDTQVGERGGELSAGERQLVALLRASVGDPDILVLDEATSSVDAATEVRLARTIDSLARGRTSVVIAHRLSTAARADRIVVMADGHVVETGTHSELVAADGAYARLYADWSAHADAFSA